MVRSLLLLCCAAACVGCAASSQAQYADSYGYESDDAMGGGYAPGAPAADSPVAIASMEAAPDAAGLFDALFAQREAVETTAVRAPAPPKAPPLPEGEAPASGASGGADPNGAAITNTRAPPTKRLVIYRASYALLVANVEDTITTFLAAVVQAGGYLEARAGESVTVRVPAARFQGLVDTLPTYGRVTSQTLQAQDVTKQFLDTQIRLENAAASRARLLELLKQAQQMEDILKIEAEVRRLTEEIERMKGELRFLSDQIAFSTITVQFQANAPPPIAWQQRQYSRFEWINRVGLERVLHDF